MGLQQTAKEVTVVSVVGATSPIKTIGELSREQHLRMQVELRHAIVVKGVIRTLLEQREEVVFVVHTISARVRRTVRTVKVGASIRVRDVQVTISVVGRSQTPLIKGVGVDVLVGGSLDSVDASVFRVSLRIGSRPVPYKRDLVNPVSSSTN